MTSNIISIGCKISTKKGTFGVKNISFMPVKTNPHLRFDIDKCEISDELNDFISISVHTGEQLSIKNINSVLN